MPKSRIRQRSSDIIIDGKEVSRQFRKRFGDPDSFYDKNYGVDYKTTGGGYSKSKKVKRGGGKPIKDKIYDFVGQFVDNRVLDVYLKYLGIATLTPATLVPIALIFGQQSFEDVVKHFKKKREQSGGKRNVPIIDNHVVGPYLKIAGLTALSLSLDTLVPLGLVMAIWHAVQSHEKKKEKSGVEQSGGGIGKFISGTHVPPGNIQLSMRYWNGQTVPNMIERPLTGFEQLSRPLSYVNQDGLQSVCNDGSCVANQFQTNKNILAHTFGFTETGVSPQIKGGDYPVRPYDGYKSSDASLTSESVSVSSDPIYPTMA